MLCDMLKIVLDTSVLTSAMRSSLGASYAVLQMIQHGQIDALVTPALFLEYEAVLTRGEQLAVSGLTTSDISRFLDAFAGFCSPVEIHFSWRPQLNDSNDEIDLIKIWPKILSGGFIGGDDFTTTPWQHDVKFEPTLVCPFSVYFAEAMDVPIAALEHGQFLIQKNNNAGFSFIDQTDLYGDLSLNKMPPSRS